MLLQSWLAARKLHKGRPPIVHAIECLCVCMTQLYFRFSTADIVKIHDSQKAFLCRAVAVSWDSLPPDLKRELASAGTGNLHASTRSNVKLIHTWQRQSSLSELLSPCCFESGR